MSPGAGRISGALIAAALIGCATVPPPGPPVPSGSAGVPHPTTVGTTVSGGAITSNAPHAAVVDSGPSAEAMAVLSSIPEPLAPGERVPPPAPTPAGAARDSGPTPLPDRASEAPADTAGEIPVPAPTEPLGDRPGTLARPSALDSALLASPPPATPPLAPAPASPDTCWRVQIAAPLAREEAELKRAAAQSLLLVAVVVEHEQGRYKVRNRDCLGRAAAGSLRLRALASGFAGAFPVAETRR